MIAVALTAEIIPAPARAQNNAPIELGAGAAWIDGDRDGDQDLVILTPFGELSYWRNQGGSVGLVDATEAVLPTAFLQNLGPGMGVAVGDLTNDGYDDIFVTTEGSNILLVNEGDGTFLRAGRSAGLTGNYLSASAALFDYDNDGFLDIFVANYSDQPNQLFRNLGVDAEGIPRFADVAPALGMDESASVGGGWSLGVATGDYDNDGDMDLYVANDYDGIDPFGELNPGPNILYRNNGDGTFTDVSVESGADDDGWAMGTAFGDYDGDGWIDIYVANFWRDALLRNNRDGTFTDVTEAVGLAEPGAPQYNSWGCAFLDYDNDGDIDIHVVNGFILNDRNQVEDEPNELWEQYLTPQGNIRFREVAQKAGLDDVGDGRGAAYADYDGDGFLDVMIVNNNFLSSGTQKASRLLCRNALDGTFVDLAQAIGLRPSPPDTPKPQGYRSLAGNAWLKVRLDGRVSNRSAIGARVRVYAGDKSWMQDVGTSSYCSTNARELHFGLGGATTVDSVVVRFPSGRVYRAKALSPNQTVFAVEPEQTPVRLLAFSAETVGNEIAVRWEYVDDGSLAQFELLREDGSAWSSVAAVLGDPTGRALVRDRGTVERTIRYALDAIHRDGSRERLAERAFVFEPPVTPRLGPSAPNPFSGSVAIALSGAQSAGAVEILDAAGRRVRRLPFAAGTRDLSWDGMDESGRPTPAGIYLYRLAGAGTSGAGKMIRVR